MGKSYKKNYVYSLINTISGLLFPLITFPYVARVLMPSGIGEVNFYLSIITYISMFASLGIPTYAIIEIAKVRSDEQKKSLRTIEILILNTTLSFFGYIIVGILCFTVPQIKANVPLFLLMSVNILLTTIGCEWFYQGTENFEFITIRGLIIRVVCVILLFILVKNSSDLIYYGLYNVIGIAGNNILNFIYLRKNIELKSIRWDNLNIKQHIWPSLRIFIASVITSIYLQLDTVMLGFLKDNASVGYYTGALRLTKMLMGLTTSLGVVFLPKLSHITTNTITHEAIELIKKTVDFIVAMSLPIATGLFLMSSILINLFCGDNYGPAVLTLKILAPIIVFIGISYIFAQSMLAINKIKITIIAGSISAGINVIANFILIPRYAQDGAAIATLFAEFASMITYIIVCKRYFHSYMIFNVHFLQCICSSILMTIVLSILLALKLTDICSLFMLPIVGMIIYSVSLVVLKNKLFIELSQTAISKIIKRERFS